MISNIMLIAFALSGCFGNEKTSTKGSNANPKTVNRGINATDKINVPNVYIKNMDQIVELAEKYVDEGDVNAFDKLLEQNPELLTEKLEAKGKGYFSKENNILHMIVDKSSSEKFNKFVLAISEYSKRDLIKLAFSKNWDDITPLEMVDDDNRGEILLAIVNGYIITSEREIREAIKEGDEVFLNIVLDTIKDSSLSKKQLFEQTFTFNSDKYDLLVLAIESGQEEMFKFLVEKLKLSTAKLYALSEVSEGKRIENSRQILNLTQIIKAKIKDDVVRDRMLAIIN